MVLVFGCRQSKIDHIYREETLQAKNKGVFRELYTAYSREPDKPKVTPGPCTGPAPQPKHTHTCSYTHAHPKLQTPPHLFGILLRDIALYCRKQEHKNMGLKHSTAHIIGCHLCEISRTARSVETADLRLPGAVATGEWGVTARGYRISF